MSFMTSHFLPVFIISFLHIRKFHLMFSEDPTGYSHVQFVISLEQQRQAQICLIDIDLWINYISTEII